MKRKKIIWKYKKGKIFYNGGPHETKMYYVFLGPDMIYYTCLFGECGNKRVSWIFDLLKHRYNVLDNRKSVKKPLRLVKNVTRSEEDYTEQLVSPFLYRTILGETEDHENLVSN